MAHETTGDRVGGAPGLEVRPERLGIHRVRALVDVDKINPGPGLGDRFRGGDTRRDEREAQRVRAAGHSDAERRLAEVREVALELPHHRTTDEAGGVERRLEHRAQLVAQLPVNGDEIEERNLMRAHRLTVLAFCRWQSRRRLATSRERPPWP